MDEIYDKLGEKFGTNVNIGLAHLASVNGNATLMVDSLKRAVDCELQASQNNGRRTDAGMAFSKLANTLNDLGHTEAAKKSSTYAYGYFSQQ